MKTDQMRTDQIRDAITKTTRMLAGRSIKVSQIGTQAKCGFNAKGEVVSINLPVIPDNPTEPFLKALQGFLDHEVAHALYTDSKVTFGLEDGKFKKAAVQGMTNLIEDVRIEREMCKLYKGSESNLEDVRHWMVENSWAPAMKALGAPQLDNPAWVEAAQSQAFVPYIRARGGHKACQQFLREQGLEEVFKPFDDMMPDLPNQLAGLKSTRDAFNLANQVLEVMANPPEDHSGGGSDGDDEGKGEGEKRKSDKSKGESKPKDKPKDKPEDKKEPKDEEGSPGEKSEEKPGDDSSAGDGASDDDGDDGDGDSSETQPEPGEGTGEPSKGKPKPIELDWDKIKDTDEELSKAMESMMKGAFKRDCMIHLTRDFDDTGPYKIVGKPDVARMEGEVQKVAAVMQKELQRIIVAKSQSYFTPGFRSGRLNGPALHRLKVNDDRVFKRRHIADTNKVAVSLVVDLSGSMSGNKCRTAMVSAFAFSQVLTQLKIPHEVSGFTTLTDYPTGFNGSEMQRQKTAMAKATGVPKFNIRDTPFYGPIFKSFEEGFTPIVKQRMSDVADTQRCLAGNNDAVALEYVGARLRSRMETRKIMIVFSDGQPCEGPGINPLGDHLIADAMRREIADLKKFGVETIGIGIMSGAVASYYPKHMRVDNVADLPAVVMKELKALLVQ